MALLEYLAFYWCSEVNHLVLVVGIHFRRFGSVGGMFFVGFDLVSVNFVGVNFVRYDKGFLAHISW